MSRLPTVGQDNNEWGTILNDYLSVEHNADGSQKFLTESVSRTIYVSATGNDDTGDGSATLPYLTIGKALSTINKIINSGVTVTISVGVGTFTLSSDDQVLLSSITGGAGILAIQGTLGLVDSGFTMGSAQALDPFTYAVSGGSTGSWSTNQYKGSFLKSGTDYYPITHNTTTTLSIAGAVTGSEIYQTQTIINIPFIGDATYPASFYNLNLISLQLIFVDSVISGITLSNSKFTNVFINNSAHRSVYFKNGNNFSFTRCAFYNLGLLLVDNSISIVSTNNYFHGNTSNYMMTVAGSEAVYYDCVLENSSTGTSSGCLRGYDKGGIRMRHNNTNKYLKFVNSKNAFITGNQSVLDYYNALSHIVFVNIDYAFKKFTAVLDYESSKINLVSSSVLGAPNIRWFYDSMYEFVNVSSGRNIQITGLIYPEYESNLSSTLADNATTNVIIGNKLQNQSIVIDYTIKRGTTYETAQLRILNDGTNLTLQEGTPLGDVGVTFAVNFNTNEIRLACTLTSTGTAATLKYNATRVMITPLTV
ncbi:MAG TPA: hypothetical protein VK153_00780 [Candidatus Paceibacterota bacterium]|nr:hypothetical protein [Candidatus Paceibacterota bacterium]